MSEVEPWQAAALALNIDPDLLGKDPYPSGNPYVWDNNPSSDYFANKEIIQQYQNLRQLLKANQFNQKYFSISIRGTIRLDEFAAWCIEIRQDIPDELKALAKHTAQPIPAAPEEALQSTTPSTDIKISEEDEEIAGLFDPVNAQGLGIIFPIVNSEKEKEKEVWIKLTERAHRNKLDTAKVKRGLFNPYKVGLWLVQRGDISIGQLRRKMANNLPTRSLGEEHLLTGDTD